MEILTAPSFKLAPNAWAVRHNSWLKEGQGIQHLSMRCCGAQYVLSWPIGGCFELCGSWDLVARCYRKGSDMQKVQGPSAQPPLNPSPSGPDVWPGFDLQNGDFGYKPGQIGSKSGQGNGVRRGVRPGGEFRLGLPCSSLESLDSSIFFGKIRTVAESTR